MAYDEELAGQIRAQLAGQPGVAEKKMFGGLAFLVGGNMAVAASGQGGMLVRVDPAESDALVASGKASLMEMGGRTMRGWLRVEPGRDLASWVERGRYRRSRGLMWNSGRRCGRVQTEPDADDGRTA